jgi:hypothetical protein
MPIFWNDTQRLEDANRGLDVLAIGDSWFHYPFNNLITPLHSALRQPVIFALGESGARADELGSGYWLARFERMLHDYPGIRLVCISAGGNDFAGLGDLDAHILRADCSAAQDVDSCYRPNGPEQVFDGVDVAYRALLGAVARANPALPVLLHYDYAIPDGRTIAAIPCWLKLPMDNCRVPPSADPRTGLRRDIVRDLIDRFTLHLDGLVDAAAAEPLARPELVWSAGTLTDREWANELHPTPRGFDRLVRDAWSGPARAALGIA